MRNLDKDDFFLPPIFDSWETSHPNPLPFCVLKEQRLELPPQNFHHRIGKCCGPAEGSRRRKMEKKRQVISSAGPTNWGGVCRAHSHKRATAQILQARSTCYFRCHRREQHKFNPHNKHYLMPTFTGSIPHDTSTQGLRSFRTHLQKTDQQTNKPRSRKTCIYSTPQKPTWNQKLGDWEDELFFLTFTLSRWLQCPFCWKRFSESTNNYAFSEANDTANFWILPTPSFQSTKKVLICFQGNLHSYTPLDETCLL